jgi:hypothetical protein
MALLGLEARGPEALLLLLCQRNRANATGNVCQTGCDSFGCKQPKIAAGDQRSTIIYGYSAIMRQA